MVVEVSHERDGYEGDMPHKTVSFDKHDHAVSFIRFQLCPSWKPALECMRSSRWQFSQKSVNVNQCKVCHSCCYG